MSETLVNCTIANLAIFCTEQETIAENLSAYDIAIDSFHHPLLASHLIQYIRQAPYIPVTPPASLSSRNLE